jgi:hypothetical protein
MKKVSKGIPISHIAQLLQYYSAFGMREVKNMALKASSGRWFSKAAVP